MSYKITKADGRSVVVKDYEKEIVGGLTLLGYGFTNYGDEMAQNFVRDLENNAGLTEPQNPVLGQFWFQVPQVLETQDKQVRICVATTAGTVDARWQTLFRITPAGQVIMDAWTLRGKAPVIPSGGSTEAGMPVVLDSNGKINGSYLPSTSEQGDVIALRNTRIFGSRNNGLPFNGTQNVPLNTSHIAESDQLYFTNQRAISALKSGRYIAVDADGTVRFTGPDPTQGGDGATGQQGPAGPQGPQGPQGIQGPQGPQGPQGATGTFDGTSGFENALGGTGWQKLPSGLYIQWGRFTWFSNMHDAYYSFATAFPNGCFQVYLSIMDNPNGSGDRNEEDDEQIWATPTSNTQFQARDTGDDHQTYPVAWFAIGY